MDENTFWQLIDRTRKSAPHDKEAQIEHLETSMKALGKSDCRDAAMLFERAYFKAYTWPMWGAAYVINGGCSDDSFEDFRTSLILLGRSVYELALIDPDSLASIDQDAEAWTFEGFQYAVCQAFEIVVGEGIENVQPEQPVSPAGQK